MKILFYFSHPAQYLFLRETIKRLKKEDKYQVHVLIKTKDVLENLIKSDKLEYENILPKERGKSKLSIALSLLNRVFKIFSIVRKIKPDLLVGTDASLTHVAFLLRKKCITITEDDYEIIKTLGDLAYPFTTTILCPTVCEVGKWSNKKIGYKGYMKLGYLHPTVFKPNRSVIGKYKFPDNYVLIRLAKLTAHHDFGIKGIDNLFLDKIINLIENKGLNVFISSEGRVDKKYKKYLLKINPEDIHHILSFSKLFICDSQSMSVEASMLGVPSIRYSSFAGKISVLEELEKKYKLTYGIKVGNEEELFNTVLKLINLDNLQETFQKRREIMLKEKIDVPSFMTWFIGNFPNSYQVMKNNNNYQNKFIND
ncbi:hypothetical protein OAV73_02105 [Flavobacteriaceae bacterium]|nr:hypothetical protein [Flavobacteriaceae bacterium]